MSLACHRLVVGVGAGGGRSDGWHIGGGGQPVGLAEAGGRAAPQGPGYPCCQGGVPYHHPHSLPPNAPPLFSPPPSYPPPPPPLLPPTRRYPDGSGRVALYRMPKGKAKGTCIFVHGCKHDPFSWFYKSPRCPMCTGEAPPPPPLLPSPPPPPRCCAGASAGARGCLGRYIIIAGVPFCPSQATASRLPLPTRPFPPACRPARGGVPLQAVPGPRLRCAGAHVAEPRVQVALLQQLWRSQ